MIIAMWRLLPSSPSVCRKGKRAMPKPRTKILLLLLGLVALLLGQPRTAEALPSFASQTGQACAACHIGAFGPQLTPFGRAFKMSGYTTQGGEGLAAKIPLSAMVLGSFNQTQTSLPPGSAPAYFGNNNNFAIDQVSVFLAGRITDWSGGFSQFTYSGVSHSYHMDQLDFRPYTTTFDFKNSDLRVGFALTNTPMVQDPYNSTYAWGFPYVFSPIAPTQAAQPLLAGGFGGNSIGLTGYAWYDRSLYLEFGGYGSDGRSALQAFGTTYGPGGTKSLAPYARGAYEWNWNSQSAHVGAMMMYANINPGPGMRIASGLNGQDGYTDLGVDGGYQYLGDGTHIFSLYGIYLHENRSLNGTTNSFNIANGTNLSAKSSLDQTRVEASYWYKNTYGLTLGLQKTWGKATVQLYQPGPVTGSNNGKPDTTGFLVEADWVPFGHDDSWGAPFVNMKIGLQYIAYTKFNGGGSNYDGSGRSAGANNTLYAFVWIAF
jgi:hypothetical protein